MGLFFRNAKGEETPVEVAAPAEAEAPANPPAPAASAPSRVEDSPEFKAMADRAARAEAKADAEAKARADAEAKVAEAADARLSADASAFAAALAAPAVARIDPAQCDAVASLYGKLAKADADGALLADMRAVFEALPTASDRFKAGAAGASFAVVEPVARGAEPDKADPAEVARLKALMGCAD